jgi:stage III sporulation protein AH
MILLLFVVGYAYNMFTTDNYIGVNYDLDIDQAASQGATVDQAQAQPSDKETSAQPKEDGQSAAVVEQNPDAIQASSSMASNFFSEYRMERDKNRSKEADMWQDVINSQNTEKTFKDQAQQELVKIVALTDKEMEIENLVISLGFSDALAFITDDSATILVEAKDLAPAQVAKIQDIVVRKTKFNPTNIKIMKKN